MFNFQRFSRLRQKKGGSSELTSQISGEFSYASKGFKTGHKDRAHSLCGFRPFSSSQLRTGTGKRCGLHYRVGRAPILRGK